MAQPATAAIYYHPEGFDTSRDKLMGRHAAGEAFLNAMARHSSAERLIAVVRKHEHYDDFKRRVDAAAGGAKKTGWIPEVQPERLAVPGAVFLPGPNLEDFAWLRRYGDQRAWSITGVTHTTSSDRIVLALGSMLTAPVQSWDAVICTSEAVREMVQGLIDRYREYLRVRLGAADAPVPQLPVIPLGVDTETLAPTDVAKSRGKALRAELGIAEDELVLLFVGRLSFHAKAHPLPNFLAAEEVAKSTGKKLRLLFSGWAANEFIDREFREGAAKFAPSVPATFVDGRDPRIRRDIWHAADIFLSLSDNIQETFGLTPLEAMASGLPVIVSDWNGYRQTVRDGEVGITVPTWLPPPGTGHDLARAYHQELDNYDQYIGYTSQLTAVDVAATGAALETLVNNKDLRAKMGGVGRKHAVAQFDWKVVVGLYEDLWGELAARRAKDTENASRDTAAPFVPLHDDPFNVFSHYPTHTIGPETRVILAEGMDAEMFKHRVSARMNQEVGRYLPGMQGLESVLENLSKDGTLTAGDLAADLAREGEPTANYLRAIGWLAKLGIVRLEE